MFTPLVQGEKVIPVFWQRIIAEPPDRTVDAANGILAVRYAFSVLCIIVPILAFLLLLYTLYAVFIVSSSSSTEPAAAAEKNPKNTETTTSGAVREVSMVGGEGNEKAV